MEKLSIQLRRKEILYPIHIGEDILSSLIGDELIRDSSCVVIITDENIAPHWLAKVQKILATKKSISICIPAGEINKNIRTLESIWEQMLQNKVDRSAVVLTLGGGVIGDMGGFAAATYMRGIPVIHTPTTLLAQTDASIGGKTAIDFIGMKNSIGVFHQPKAIYIDVQTLTTLPQRELISGYAEIIKHAIIADKSFLDRLNKKKPSEITPDEWIRIIHDSALIKKNIIEQDEEEKNGVRKKLNFGHTVGHAVESLSLETEHPLLHGEAISIGMMAEAHISRLKGLISEKVEKQIHDSLIHAGLPVRLEHLDIEKALAIISSDKKNKKGEVLWSLPSSIGNVVTDIRVETETVIKALESTVKS